MNNLSNFDSVDPRNRAGSVMSEHQKSSKNIPVYKSNDGYSVDDENQGTKRSKASSIYGRSPKSTSIKYEEAKQILQHTDRDTVEFLDYLENFQKENVIINKRQL